MKNNNSKYNRLIEKMIACIDSLDDNSIIELYCLINRILIHRNLLPIDKSND